MRALKILLLSFILISTLNAQPPENYYNGTEGLTGQALLDKLNEIITNGHITLNYSDLYNYYKSTDRCPGTNKVWDMYSMDANCNAQYYYYFDNGDECGTYQTEGDCYNREHSIPASWFNDNYPMYADLFIVYPTDGYVNNRRSNYIYGKVDNPTWTSTNGSKVGTNSYPNGPVVTAFEPIDDYKGDFARTYFYVATRYKYDIPNWDFSTPLQYVFNTDGTFKQWALDMFIQWHKLDPVSDKEIARNDSVFKIQGNRNPFIDHPEFVDYIWIEDSSTTIDFDTIFFESFTNCPPNEWLTFAPDGSNGWKCSNYGYMYANAYGANSPSDDWLISPKIDPQGQTVILKFRTYTKYTDQGVNYPPLHVYISTNYDGISDPQTANWTELSWTAPTENSQTWTSSGDIQITVNQPFYIAFRYLSSGTTAGYCALWEVDNVLVGYQKITTSYLPIYRKNFDVEIYPNPLIDNQLSISLDLPNPSNVKIQIYNLSGMLIENLNLGILESGRKVIHINTNFLNSQMLIVKIITNFGIITKKIIKF